MSNAKRKISSNLATSVLGVCYPDFDHLEPSYTEECCKIILQLVKQERNIVFILSGKSYEPLSPAVKFGGTN